MLSDLRCKKYKKLGKQDSVSGILMAFTSLTALFMLVLVLERCAQRYGTLVAATDTN